MSTSDTTTPDETTILTAEQFARDMDEKAAAREHALRVKRADARTTIILAAIWAPVVLGLFAGIAFLVWQVTSQNTQRERNREELRSRQVTVWCYADPNSDRGTSTVTGTPDEVRGFCPDAYRGYTAGG